MTEGRNEAASLSAGQTMPWTCSNPSFCSESQSCNQLRLLLLSFPTLSVPQNRVELEWPQFFVCLSSNEREVGWDKFSLDLGGTGLYGSYGVLSLSS